MRFKQFLKENQNKNCLIIGRFQPPSKMHIEIVEDALKDYNIVYLCVVKGRKTPHERSPFSFNTIKEIFKTIINSNKLKIFESSTGYIPKIIEEFNLDVDVVIAGSDRFREYKRQLKGTDIEVKEFPRIINISGTQIRNALIDNDYEEYKKLVSSKISSKEWFNKLKKEISYEV